MLFDELSNLVLVTGSYAAGCQTDRSDIDFYLPTENFNKVLEILSRYDEPIKTAHTNSEHCGIFVQKSDEHPLLEFSDVFDQRGNGQVELYGVTFNTW